MNRRDGTKTLYTHLMDSKVMGLFARGKRLFFVSRYSFLVGDGRTGGISRRIRGVLCLEACYLELDYFLWGWREISTEGRVDFSRCVIPDTGRSSCFPVRRLVGGAVACAFMVRVRCRGSGRRAGGV